MPPRGMSMPLGGVNMIPRVIDMHLGGSTCSLGGFNMPPRVVNLLLGE